MDIQTATDLLTKHGDPVKYRGQAWLYIRDVDETLDRAILILKRERRLKRWSAKTPNLIRIMETTQ